MKAQNTINLGQISGEMNTWNTFILGSKGLIITNYGFFFKYALRTAADLIIRLLLYCRLAIPDLLLKC